MHLELECDLILSSSSPWKTTNTLWLILKYKVTASYKNRCISGFSGTSIISPTLTLLSPSLSEVGSGCLHLHLRYSISYSEKTSSCLTCDIICPHNPGCYAAATRCIKSPSIMVWHLKLKGHCQFFSIFKLFAFFSNCYTFSATWKFSFHFYHALFNVIGSLFYIACFYWSLKSTFCFSSLINWICLLACTPVIARNKMYKIFLNLHKYY